MKKDGILVLLRPFTKMQKFYILKDGEVTFEGHLPLDERLGSEIVEFAAKYDLPHVTIAGPASFAESTRKSIMEGAVTKYKNIEVEILSKR